MYEICTLWIHQTTDAVGILCFDQPIQAAPELGPNLPPFLPSHLCSPFHWMIGSLVAAAKAADAAAAAASPAAAQARAPAVAAAACHCYGPGVVGA
jgi:hypothetical protein